MSLPFQRSVEHQPVFEQHPQVVTRAELTETPAWPKVFHNDHPIKVDIGSGKGKFLVEMAQAEPWANFIGIKIFHDGIRKTLKKVNALRLTNIRLLHATAREALEYCFSSSQINTIYISFPDPWPKKRHARRRIVQPATVALLADRLTLGGQVILATDVESYARDMLQCFLADNRFRSTYVDGIVKMLPDRIVSLYEEKFLAQNLPVYYASLMKTLAE